MEEDEVIVSKIYTSINRGDIFVFSHESSEELLIKRVVGLPGEKVEVKDGLLYVNDVFIDEPYVKNNEPMNKTFYVPEGNYLFFGDNRARSEDARRWENPYVPKKNLDGKALFTVYPKDRIGFLK
ncbi:signal peptidase I [Clostridium perfringens F262]|nr:signal peptidase I [Clostridium perfringens F262]